VNDFYETNIPGYYAIGDITKGPALAHVASAEGILCVEKIAGHNVQKLDYDNIPGCTYCSPEVASVGMTEKQAKENGYDILIGKFPFSASGKAKASGNSEGFVKVIFDKKYGHSISTRILDKNRVFEAVGSRFQFTEEALLGETFTLINNKAGTGDNRNVINMLDLQLEKMADKGKGNFQEIFSNTLAKVGSNVQANDLSLTAASSNRDAAEASQSEFSGVSLDDEAAHLLEFQQAYQASARILQTARELFESLIKVV